MEGLSSVKGMRREGGQRNKERGNLKSKVKERTGPSQAKGKLVITNVLANSTTERGSTTTRHNVGRQSIPEGDNNTKD